MATTIKFDEKSVKTSPKITDMIPILDMEDMTSEGHPKIKQAELGKLPFMPLIPHDVSELIPIEVFDDGDTPPDEVAVIDTVVRYRDFSTSENVMLEYPRPREYDSALPLYIALKIIVTDAGGISSGDVLQFEYKFKEIGGAFFTTVINWVADTDYPQNSVITTPLTEITDSIYDINVIELERVDSGEAGEYANKIGVLYLEFVWSKI